MKGKFQSIIKSGGDLKLEVRKKVVGYITAGFGVVAGLAWNDAIKTFIEEYFPQTGSTMIAKFVYALLITIVLVVISVYLVKLFNIESKSKE